MRSGPAVVPSYPLPAAVVTPAAVGTLRALAGVLVGGAAVMVVLAAALIVSGGIRSRSVPPARRCSRSDSRARRQR